MSRHALRNVACQAPYCLARQDPKVRHPDTLRNCLHGVAYRVRTGIP